MGVLSRSHTHLSKNVFKPFYIDLKIFFFAYVFFLLLAYILCILQKGTEEI